MGENSLQLLAMVLIYQSLMRHKAGPSDCSRRILGMNNELTQSSLFKLLKNRERERKKKKSNRLASLLL